MSGRNARSRPGTATTLRRAAVPLLILGGPATAWSQTTVSDASTAPSTLGAPGLPSDLALTPGTNLASPGTQYAQTTPTAAAITPGTAITSDASQLSAPVGASSPLQIQKIIVGSRLHVNNLTSPDPVTIVSAKDIQALPAQNVEEVLQRLPSIGSGGTYRTTTNGGEGEQCTDFRNLGYTRVLVLINGKRFVHTGIFGQDCVDLSVIPVSMVDQIQVLKDGASSIYGADAVSGVINIVLKEDFNGTQIDANGLISASGDDRSGLLSATEGFNFDHKKGNFTLNLQYNSQGPIAQNARDWSTHTVTTEPPPGGMYRFGSGFPPNGRVFDSPNAPDPLGLNSLALGNGQFRPFSNRRDRFEYSQYAQLLGQLQTANVVQSGHYRFDNHFDLYENVFYAHKSAVTQLSPQPVSGGLGAGLPPDFIIPQGNPYNPFGEDIAVYKRTAEFGPRVNTANNDLFQGEVGLKGYIAAGWNYDASYSYGDSGGTQRSSGEVNFARLEQTVGFRQTNDPNAAVPADAGYYDPTVCSVADGCALTNVLGPNSINQAAVDYARFTEVSHSEFLLRDINAGFTNDHLVQLPYGPLGVAIGMEHRGEQGSYKPDPLVQSGVTLENAQQPTSGGFNASEAYGEIHVPILKNLVAAKDLSADLSGRYSSYNTFGDAETWKIGGNWTPIQDIRVRGSIGTAFRQPGVNELFGGQSLSFDAAQDPCVGATGVAAANCARQGIDVANFAQPNAQVQAIAGGNPALQPETARTYTFGTVLTPRYIPNLGISVDYWRTKIDHQIGAVDVQTILNNCYNSPGLTNSFCSLISPRTGLGQLGTISDINQNLGTLRADGLDVGGSYLWLINDVNSITFTTELAFTFLYTQQFVPNGPFINFNGYVNLGSNITQGFPRIRDASSVTWNHDRFSFQYRLQYIDGMRYYPGTQYGPGISRDYQTNEVFYHDIEASYRFKHLILIGGIDNLFDRTPPFVPNGSANTSPSVYDVVGRLFYAKAQINF